MKGIPGLMIALGLGILGAFCNWLYLAQKSDERERVDFIVIEEGTKINPGDKFTESHFRRLSIPKDATGQLEKAAFRWIEMESIVGMAATKSFSPGEILLRQYLRTPPENDIKKLLAPDERAFSILVDARGFVSSLLAAGDQVSFVVPKSALGATISSEGSGGEIAATATNGTPIEIIGPFRILALGNRMGSPEIMKGYGGNAAQENVMTIAIKMEKNGLPDARAQQISEVLRQTGFQQVQVLLHPAADAKASK